MNCGQTVVRYKKALCIHCIHFHKELFIKLQHNNSGNRSAQSVCQNRTITFEEFVDGESNEAYELFEEMLEESKVTSMSILEELYWEKVKEDDISFLLKLLNILAYCPFQQIKEAGLCLFASAIVHKNVKVKSMALRVAGHWACPELLTYLDKLDITEYPFLEKKYYSIKTKIQEKWNLQEK